MAARMSCRQIALVFSLLVFGENSAANAKSCELHVWAEGNKGGPALDPQTLTPTQRSQPANVLDAGQRLFELDPKQLIASLMLPSDTRVTIHTEAQLIGKQAEQTNSRLSPSNASCYFDWTFRPDATFGPTPGGRANIFARWIVNYGTLSFYSIFKAYGPSGNPYLTVKGVHQGRLPVLSTSEQKKPIYDTQNATRELVENAVRKIHDKLNGQSLIQSY